LSRYLFCSRHSVNRLESSVDACEQRDRKGGYAKSGPGIIKEFSGISNPSEKPADGHVVIDTIEFEQEAA
jgi:sulfate adenylyltransferase